MCRGREEGEKEGVVRAVVIVVAVAAWLWPAWLGGCCGGWVLTSSPLKAAAALGTIGPTVRIHLVRPCSCGGVLAKRLPLPWPPPVVARVVVAVTVVVGVEAVAAAVVEVEGESEGPWRGCPCFAVPGWRKGCLLEGGCGSAGIGAAAAAAGGWWWCSPLPLLAALV